MHSLRFGECPVSWHHEPDLTGLTTDEPGPAFQRAAHPHKEHSSPNEIPPAKKGNFSFTCQEALAVEKDTETRDGIREQPAW